MRFFELGPKTQQALHELLADHRDNVALAGFIEALQPPKVLITITGFPEGAPPGVTDPGLTEEEDKALAALEEALEHASGRSCTRITEEVAELRHKRAGTFDPELYPQRAGLQCPYCEAIHWDGDEEGIRVVDVALRWSSFGYRAEESDIHGDYDSRNADFEGDHYECETCDHEVALPDDVTEDGW